MSTEQNKKIILRLFGEGVMERNFRVFDELIADEFVNHGLPFANSGPAGFREMIQHFITAFPDMQINIQQIIADGDSVATRGFLSGTHSGNFMGVFPTGKKIQIDYLDFWKIRNGMCSECWLKMDMAGLMQQVGPLQYAL